MTARTPLCADCQCDVRLQGEIAYMVRESLWQTVGADRGFLCVGCLEARMSRRLDRHDFALLGVNLSGFGRKSGRLLDRLGDFDAACGTAAYRAIAEIQARNLSQIRTTATVPFDSGVGRGIVGP